MPVMWQVFELRGVRDADLMLMTESDKEALLVQILSEQEAEHGYARQKLNKGHPLLHQYWIEIPLGSRKTETTKNTANYVKTATVTAKDAALPASKKRKEPPSGDLSVTVWGEVLGAKKVLFNAVGKAEKLLGKCEDLEVQLATRCRHVPQNEELPVLLTQLQDLSPKVQASVDEARTILNAVPKSAKACEGRMDQIQQNLTRLEEGLAQLCEDLGGLQDNIKRSVRASKVRK